MHPDDDMDAMKYCVRDENGNLIELQEATEDIRTEPVMYEQYCNPEEYQFEISLRMIRTHWRGLFDCLIGRTDTKSAQRYRRSVKRNREKERRRKLKERTQKA